MAGTEGNVIAVRGLTSRFWSQGSYDLISGNIGQNPELESLVAAAFAEPNEAKRREMVARGLRMAMDTRVVAVIGTVPIVAALGPDVDIALPPGAHSIAEHADIAKHRKQ